jgi:hypothetical protein
MSEYELVALYFVEKQEHCFEKKEVCIEQTGTVYCKTRTLY